MCYLFFRLNNEIQAASSSSASADSRLTYLSNQVYGPYDSAANMKNSVIFPNKIHFPKTSRRLPQVREPNSNKK